VDAYARRTGLLLPASTWRRGPPGTRRGGGGGLDDKPFGGLAHADGSGAADRCPELVDGGALQRRGLAAGAAAGRTVRLVAPGAARSRPPPLASG